MSLFKKILQHLDPNSYHSCIFCTESYKMYNVSDDKSDFDIRCFNCKSYQRYYKNEIEMFTLTTNKYFIECYFEPHPIEMFVRINKTINFVTVYSTEFIKLPYIKNINSQNADALIDRYMLLL